MVNYAKIDQEARANYIKHKAPCTQERKLIALKAIYESKLTKKGMVKMWGKLNTALDNLDDAESVTD